MQARAVDLIKVAPKPATRSASDATSPAPRTRFDDELSRHTRPANDPTKAESRKPEPAVKAKPRHGGHKPVDDAPPADNARDANEDTDAVDPEETAVESDNATAKADKIKTKSTKKADAKKADGDDEACEETAASADTSKAVALPTAGADVADGDDLAIDADAAKGDTDHTDTDADANVDPDAAAAQQLVAQQAAASSVTTDTTADANGAGDATAAATPVSAMSVKSASATAQTAATDEPTEAVPRHAHAAKATDAKAGEADADADVEVAGAFQLPPDAEKAAASTADKKEDFSALSDAIQPTAAHGKASASAPLPPPTTPQAGPPRDIAEHNVDQIVTSVRGELLTKGGTMDIRLDPPTLGHVQVQITVDDGVLSANIQTNNDEATRLLSHNLAQLKTQLESAGVTVDRIQVKQATPAEQSNSSSNQQNPDGDGHQQSAASQDQSARQEQQRREALQRMWARVAGNGDPLDLVA